MIQVQFIGYFEYEPTHFHAEFIVKGHHVFPDGMQADYDTLRRLTIPIPEFPSYHTWTRLRYIRKLRNRELLRGLWGNPCHQV